MRIEQETIGLTVDDSLMRVHVARPVGTGPWPGILFYSDIYQLGGPILRLANRLAGYGFVVAAPEIFHRIEPVGSVIEPDAIGRLRGNDAARRTEIAQHDADADAVLQWLSADAGVDAERLGALGFCIGGHLAFRAALRLQVKATPASIRPACTTASWVEVWRIRCNGAARFRGRCSRCSAPRIPMCQRTIGSRLLRP